MRRLERFDCLTIAKSVPMPVLSPSKMPPWVPLVELYFTQVSPSFISTTTDAVLHQVRAWQYNAHTLPAV